MIYAKAFVTRARDRWPLTAEQTYAGAIIILFAILLTLIFAAESFGQSGVFGPNKPHKYVWTPYMAALDSSIGEHYADVPWGVCQAFAEGESNYDTTAIRFEPAYKAHYGKTIKLHAIDWCRKNHFVRSIETEFDQRCYSYSAHQNMGENLREAGFDEPTIAHITVEQDFVMFYEVFHKLLNKYRAKHGVHHVTRECFLDACAAYNGGPGAVLGNGHYRNWPYVKDKEDRMLRIYGRPDWGKF